MFWVGAPELVSVAATPGAERLGGAVLVVVPTPYDPPVSLFLNQEEHRASSSYRRRHR